jgi:hypothetical protein
MTHHDKPAHHCPDLERINRKPARSLPPGWWIFPFTVLGGMLLFAALVNADPIGRTADAVANPHLEGFE